MNKRKFRRELYSEPKISERVLKLFKEAKEYRNAGYTYDEIAKAMGVSYASAYYYVNADSYKAYINGLHVRAHTCSDVEVDIENNRRADLKRENYANNKEVYNAKLNAWRDANRDKYNAQCLARYHAHKDKINAKRNAKNAAHRDEYNAYARAWYAANKDKVKAQRAAKRKVKKDINQD